ncbi:hypothetical protein [Tersicoccus solisilvae]|nr:hypothetical protein [Tersicoccus solisilvae]
MITLTGRRLRAVAATLILGLGITAMGATPAQAATTASATTDGGYFRGTIYHQEYYYGNDSWSISGRLTDTAGNGRPVELQVRYQWILKSGMVQTSKVKVIDSTGTTKSVYASAATPDVATWRLQYRVCAPTCSTWQYTSWR